MDNLAERISIDCCMRVELEQAGCTAHTSKLAESKLDRQTMKDLDKRIIIVALEQQLLQPWCCCEISY